MKKNKPFTVHDFIIFVRAKILIIFLFTSLLSSITLYIQKNNYDNYWQVSLSRNINKNALLKSVQIINRNFKIEARKYNETPIRTNTIDLLMMIVSLEEQTIAGNLIAEGFVYTDESVTARRDLLKEKKYDFVIDNTIKKLEKQDVENAIDLVINDTNRLITEILKIQYETNKLEGLNFFDFKILELYEIIGYKYSKILKVILIYFTTFILIFFLYDRRKSINLF